MSAPACQTTEPAPPAAEGCHSAAEGIDYLPRAAMEAILYAAARRLRDSSDPPLIVGPAGVGKTLLLHVLSWRLRESFRSCYLPMPTLPQSEICAFALGLLGTTAGLHPETNLLDLAVEQRKQSRPLLLLIDDAGSMNLHTARGMAALAAASQGCLRLVYAVTEGPKAAELAEAIGSDPCAVPPVPPMTPAETRAYLSHRSDASGVDLDAHYARCGGLDEVVRAGRGIPALLHQLLNGNQRMR